MFFLSLLLAISLSQTKSIICTCLRIMCLRFHNMVVALQNVTNLLIGSFIYIFDYIENINISDSISLQVSNKDIIVILIP